MNKERPILFSTPMVQALLSDTKTNTRRLNALEKINEEPDRWEYHRFYNGYAKFTEKHNAINEVYVKCPYGQVGDILWVRETFRVTGFKSLTESVSGEWCADKKSFHDLFLKRHEWEKFYKWNRKIGNHSSLFMFKSLSRIRLQITDIKVEKLQDISEEDVKVEGVEGIECRYL